MNAGEWFTRWVAQAADDAEANARNMAAVAENEVDAQARRVWIDEARNWERIARSLRGERA
jgi:hypothetical protein